MKGRRGEVQRATSQDDAFCSEWVFFCSHLRARFIHLAPGLTWWRRQIIYLPFSRKEVMWNLRGRRTSVRSDLSELHSQQFNRRLLQDDLRGEKRSFGLRARFGIILMKRLVFPSLRRQSTTAPFCSRSWDKRSWWTSGTEDAAELLELLVCQRHYGALISWLAPVFGSLGFLELRRSPGIPIHVGWSTGPQPEVKAAVMREKERSVYPCPLCAFNHLPSCLPQPCPHNRVLTGAVSRQRYCDHCGHWG